MDRFKILKGIGYDWETFIYIMHDIEGCKFGITNDIEQRQKRYRKERPTLKLKYCKPLNNRNIARLIEYKMKLRFPIIKGLETTSASLKELIDFIETSNTDLDQAILELYDIPQTIHNDNNKSLDDSRKDKLGKSYSLEDKRKDNSNAYFKWTNEDDERLETLYCEGKSIKELCELFARNSGSISSRIKKLELKEKYCS
jgi:hypothetical protein